MSLGDTCLWHVSGTCTYIWNLALIFHPVAQMGILSVTTNLSGFGCFMQGLIDRLQDEGRYVVDCRLQSAEDSVNHLTDCMLSFCSKTQRQQINQRNHVERLSPLLD